MLILDQTLTLGDETAPLLGEQQVKITAGPVVRFINALHEAFDPDVFVDSGQIEVDWYEHKVGRVRKTSYYSLSPGRHDFQFGWSDGTVSLPLDTGKAYSVIAISKGADITPLILTDDPSTLTRNRARVRIIYSGPDTGAPTISAWAKDSSGERVNICSGLPLYWASEYKEIDTNFTTLVFKDANGQSVEVNIGPSTDRIYDAFVYSRRPTVY